MARKRFGEDDILRLIREVEVHSNCQLVLPGDRPTGKE